MNERIGALLLGGLPEKYKPMIMGLENSESPITSHSIKTRLQYIQNVVHVFNVPLTSSKNQYYYYHPGDPLLFKNKGRKNCKWRLTNHLKNDTLSRS